MSTGFTEPPPEIGHIRYGLNSYPAFWNFGFSVAFPEREREDTDPEWQVNFYFGPWEFFIEEYIGEPPEEP